MKKVFLLLALATAVFSCNNIGDDEFVLEGSVKDVPNGKQVILQKQDELKGPVAVDTAKIEDGKFKFTGKISEPELYLLAIEGVQSRSFLILENGKINIEIMKDSIFKNKISGTYNNEQLTEFNAIGIKVQKSVQAKLKAFETENTAAMKQAVDTKDTTTINKLRNGYQNIQKEVEVATEAYVKDHPKSYVSLLLIQTLFNSPRADMKQIEIHFNSLEPELKKTKLGLSIAKKIQDYKNVAVGRMAPDFSAPNPEGKMISLKESLGKVTIVDFWASWCGPCRAENPNVVALYNEFADKGLHIISVSLDRQGQADKWKEAIAKDKLTWTNVSNLKYWEDPIAALYNVKAIPSMFVLKKDGIVVAKDLQGEALKMKVAQLLAAS